MYTINTTDLQFVIRPLHNPFFLGRAQTCICSLTTLRTDRTILLMLFIISFLTLTFSSSCLGCWGSISILKPKFRKECFKFIKIIFLLKRSTILDYWFFIILGVVTKHCNHISTFIKMIYPNSSAIQIFLKGKIPLILI